MACLLCGSVTLGDRHRGIPAIPSRRLGAAEPLRPHCARRSLIGPIGALGSRAHADDGVLSVRPSGAAQRHLPIAAPSRSSSPRGQACSPEPCKAAPGWLLPLSPANGVSMRAARSPGAQVFDGRPEDTWACGLSRICAGSCDPALVGSPATRITYLTPARARTHARRPGRRCITAAVCVVTGPRLPDPRRAR
jgi:hypothetical protein